MSSDPRRELRRLQDSPVFKTYTELRRMLMCYEMMASKLDELRDAIREVRRKGAAHWSRYEVLESETMRLCQLLADFLSRMYSCKNLASVTAKRHGIDREFRALKHDGLGFEASVVVNLRNYVVHVDLMPLEVDPGTGAVVFTRRCGSDQMWSADQRRYLRSVDLEGLLVTYRGMLDVFYARFFGMLSRASSADLRECRGEIGAVNRRVGFELVRFDPFAEARERLAEA